MAVACSVHCVPWAANSSSPELAALFSCGGKCALLLEFAAVMSADARNVAAVALHVHHMPGSRNSYKVWGGQKAIRVAVGVYIESDDLAAVVDPV